MCLLVRLFLLVCVSARLSVAELCFSIVTHDRTLDAQVEDKKTQAMWVLAAEYLKFGLANILKDKVGVVVPGPLSLCAVFFFSCAH